MTQRSRDILAFIVIVAVLGLLGIMCCVARNP